MSRSPALEVQGLRTLRATLKAAGLTLDDLKAAHADVARIVAIRATSVVPHRTGRLAATIRSSGVQSGAVVRAGTAGVPYANPIHWGWPARHITAQPFITDAAEATRDAWETAYLRALEDIIDTIEGAPRP